MLFSFQEHLQAILAIADKHCLPVIADEIYGNQASMCATDTHMFYPHVLVRMHALKGLACLACHSSKLACLALLERGGLRRSHRLRATLAAAPTLFAHTFGPYHMEKIFGTGTSGSRKIDMCCLCLLCKLHAYIIWRHHA